MDTREKIQTWEELRPALAMGEWTVIAGSFAPLTADLAGRIESAAKPGKRLLIVVEPESDPLFTADAQAVLLASLRTVDAVMIESAEEWRSAVAENAAVMVHEDAEAGLRNRREFENLVFTRQRSRSEG